MNATTFVVATVTAVSVLGENAQFGQHSDDDAQPRRYDVR